MKAILSKISKTVSKKVRFFSCHFFQKNEGAYCKLSVNSPGNLKTGLCVNLLNSRF